MADHSTREAAQRALHGAQQAFVELNNWLEDRADADHPAGALGPLPNDEMRMLGELELIRKGFTAQSARIVELEEALRDIGVYGCGMLNQPIAMNAPDEVWLRQRIARYEQAARKALVSTNEEGTSDDD